MLIAVGTDFLKVNVHLDQAATIPLKERIEENESVADNVAAVQYREKDSKSI